MARVHEKFLAQVGKLRRRARRDLVLRRLVQGLFFGCLAGVVIAALGGTLRLPVPAAFVAGAAVGAGAAAGAAVGLARRIDTRLLLIKADRALASRELASTAWEIAGSRSGSAGGLFAEAILEDAGRLLAGSPPRLMLGKLRLPLLPFVAPVAALMLLASLFPFDIRGLFAVHAPPAREVVLLGEDLEGLGRRLGAAAREQGAGRSLELAWELEQLGRDLQERSIERDEALERLDDLRKRLAQEYSLRLERYPLGEGRQRVGGEQEIGSDSQQGESAKREGSSSGIEESRPSDQGTKDLADAMNSLDELKDRASGLGPREADPSRLGRGGGPAGSRENGSDSASDSAGGTNEGGTNEGGAQNLASREPGSAPVPDRKGQAAAIPESPAGKPLRAQSTSEGEGEAMRLLVRSLPAWTGSKVPEERVLRDYQRRAESSLAREEVPVELMPYVKSYFITIGMGAGGE
jgi:hypothetical protein